MSAPPTEQAKARTTSARPRGSVDEAEADTYKLLKVDSPGSSGYDAGMRLDFGAKPWSAVGVMRSESPLLPIYTTDLGRLYEGDCMKVLPTVEDESIDTVFADP